MFYTNQKGKAVPISPPTIDEPQVPVGTVFHYAGATEPEGWLICDGRELDINEYKELFETIGYTYGGADEKFKLPDFRETAAVGVGTRDPSVDVYSLGEFKDDQFASHTHTQASHTHTGVAHCHPTAVSHSHTTVHCHDYAQTQQGVKFAPIGCKCTDGSLYITINSTGLGCLCCCSASGDTTVTANATTFYAAHNSSTDTATNCNTGASTGTRGRRIALNFIIYTGAKK